MKTYTLPQQVGWGGGGNELEKQMPITHTPWLLWKEWMSYLSQFNAGVQLGTPVQNIQFKSRLTALYWLFKCKHTKNTTPSTTVEQGDIQSAKDVAEKLKDDKFYDLRQDDETKIRFIL